MRKSKFILLSLLTIIILTLNGCKNRIVDQLRPETIAFLTNQEKARCSCLDMYGDEFIKKTNDGLAYINQLEGQYNLDSLTLTEVYKIKLDLVRTTSIIKTVSSCVAEKTPPIDQFTGMLMQEDLRVVLELDSSMTETEKLERMNVPNIELLDQFCPQHKEAFLNLQKIIKAAEILPPSLQ